ncbi:MAG TPA: transposase [Bradyrhizobium sp.]|nr:transposase [Bradyrhizobium sp.]
MSVQIGVSTLADWVGAAAANLRPLLDEIQAHVLAAERIHADDMTVPVPPNARYARLLSAPRTGPPPAPMRAAAARRPSTP